MLFGKRLIKQRLNVSLCWLEEDVCMELDGQGALCPGPLGRDASGYSSFVSFSQGNKATSPVSDEAEIDPMQRAAIACTGFFSRPFQIYSPSKCICDIAIIKSKILDRFLQSAQTESDSDNYTGI